ncbi:MAG: bifunctional riboflavin kinase/FAD synthetase [Bacteroidales bacterium]|nr:bifunctional riboflavin kinase/FAD synthetase [Bacteroidales bacterium]
MIIHYGCESLNLGSPVVTLGIFDGVHRGHMTLLSSLVLRAKEANGESVVITFSPHPRLVLSKDQADLMFLTTMKEKQVLLDGAGIDHLMVLDFSEEFSRMNACDFVSEVLVDKIGTKHLLVGYNHHFGRRGEGDFNTIVQCSESFNFKVEQVQGFQTEEGAISSSIIRKALTEGRLDAANSMLGYPYSLSGEVVPGKQLGRSLGFPTANIKPDDKHKLIPANGVYAVEVMIKGTEYKGMLSIGTNPTVNDSSADRSIEVNILNFEKDIYGENITITFKKWLRDEIRFNNVSELTRQMEIDKQDTIRLLSHK